MDEFTANKLKGALWGSVLGDAVGNLFEGMSKAHVRAVFKNFNAFIDPMPGLKGKEYRWKKPGLYTAISQMMFLFGIAFPWQKKTISIQSVIAKASTTGECEWGIFRHPDSLLRDFIKRCRIYDNEGTFSDGNLQCAIHPCIFTSFFALPSHILRDIIPISLKYARLFTINEWGLAMLVISMRAIHSLIIESVNHNYLKELIIDAAHSALKWCSDHAEELFSLRINPESFLQKMRECIGAIEIINSAHTREEAEQKICRYATAYLHHPITRASTNHPLLVFPFAFAHLLFTPEHSSHPIFTAASEGGSSGLLTSTVGMIAGAKQGFSSLPLTLRENLINKSEISRMIDALCENRHSSLQIEKYLSSELSLTNKENEERNARLKHIKQKKKNVSPKKAEETLTKIIVESWTKMDKAKWKKQKKKYHGE
ncbi:MAG: ADP-ribosylglycohydrolase family protein [Spirochaetes bacterium]|nr:ADP-ribosylglycohydrolase family protein [Spirochaetota bacterium]